MIHCAIILGLFVAFWLSFAQAPGATLPWMRGYGMVSASDPRFPLRTDQAPSQDVIELSKPIERELTGGDNHRYTISLAAGQYLRVVVAQLSIDVSVALMAPNGEKLITADSLSYADGQETVSTLAEAAGIYRLEVRSPDEPSYKGRYEVKITDLRAATGADRQRAEAERLVAQGEELWRRQTLATSEEALKRYEEALPLWRAAEDRAGEAATLNKIGWINDRLYLMPKAIGALNQALMLWRAAGDRAGEAETLTNLGYAYHYIAETQKALEYFTRALELHRAVGARREEGRTIVYVGRYYDAVGQATRALDCYAQGLPILRAVRDTESEGIALTSMAVSYVVVGEQGKSLELAGQALKLHRSRNHRFGEAFALYVLGDVCEMINEKEQSRTYLTQAIGRAREIGARIIEAAALEEFGYLHRLLELPREAITYSNQALALWRVIGYKRGEANTLKDLGAEHEAIGQIQKALDYLFSGLKILREIGDQHGEGGTLNEIAVVYYHLGDFSNALEYFHQSLRLNRLLGDPRREWNALLWMSMVERDLGHLAQAQALFEEGARILESLRSKFTSTDLRAINYAGYYYPYVDILMRRHRQKPDAGFDAAALQASESGRARGLLELLEEAGADLHHGVDPALLAQQDSLRQQLKAKAADQNKLSGQPANDAQATQLANQLADLKTDLQRVEAQINSQNPRYATLTQPRPLSLAEIRRQVLDDDTLLLEYSLGDQHSYLWAVTTASLETYELPNRAVITEAARRVYGLLTARKLHPKFETPEDRQSRVNRADAEYKTAAAELSKMVLGPVAAQLGDKRLLIVADGWLQYVPFAALPEPAGGNQKAEGGKQQAEGGDDGGTRRGKADRSIAAAPLMVNHEITNLPSASTLAVMRRELAGRKLAPKTVVVLGDPVFDKNDERVKVSLATTRPAESKVNAAPTPADAIDLTRGVERASRDVDGDEERGSRARLPFTRQEAKAILALAPAGSRREAIDFDASRATATSAELGQYRYVHFATHGFLDNVHPELSGLVLSQVDRDGSEVDGYLRLVEIFNLKLPAELVVLSGCRTGLGREVNGEGLIGLTRGFMYAGAARVMVSLWDVNDQATAELMARFYRGVLKEKLSPAAALRTAQIEQQREKGRQSPYFWAGFTLQGEPR